MLLGGTGFLQSVRVGHVDKYHMWVLLGDMCFFQNVLGWARSPIFYVVGVVWAYGDLAKRYGRVDIAKCNLLRMLLWVAIILHSVCGLGK